MANAGSDQETYSKIPVLATRVNESNASPKGKPSYSGSFTEKLMLRTLSSPTLLQRPDKENRTSADISGEAGGTGAPLQSVLAKWQCKNLCTIDKSGSPATYSVMDLLSRRSNDTSSSVNYNNHQGEPGMRH